jgi:amino acid transporter
VSYGLSRNGYVPQIFERLGNRGVPWFGVVTAFVIGCICFLPFPSWQSLVGLITSASVLMYAGAPLSLGVFRRRLPDAERPYRLPAAEVLSPLAFVVSGLIILWSGWDTDWKLGVAILLGYGSRPPDRGGGARAGSRPGGRVWPQVRAVPRSCRKPCAAAL